MSEWINSPHPALLSILIGWFIADVARFIYWCIKVYREEKESYKNGEWE